MPSDCRDWPKPLRLSAAAADLAKALYVARCEAYSVPAQDWTELPWHLRQALLEVAIRTVRALDPAPDFAAQLYTYATTLAKEHAVRLAKRPVTIEERRRELDAITRGR